MNYHLSANSNPAELTSRLRHITDELRVVEKSLSEIAASYPSQPGPVKKAEHQQLLNSLRDITLMADLKIVLDHVRQVLRAYMDTLADRTGDSKDYTEQVCRVQRSTEALRLEHERTLKVAHESLAKRFSFIDRIDSLVERRLSQQTATKTAASL